MDTHRIIVTKIATRAVAEHLDDDARSVTSDSPHVCLETFTAPAGTAGSPLLASSNQWGQTPFPPAPMSRLAVSRQARDLLDGIITVHRELPVHRAEPSGGALPRTHAAVDPVSPAPGYGPEQHRVALARRRADLADLAGVATDLAAVDQQAGELDQRITQLLTLATEPSSV